MFRRPYSPPQPSQMTQTSDGVYELLRPRYLPWATRALIALIVLTFFAQLLVPGLTEHAAIDGDAIRRGEWWRVVTGAFVHGGVLHVGLNAYFGYSIGARIERYIGALRLVLITAASIAGAAAAIAMAGGVAVGFSGVLYGWLASWLAFHLTPRFPGLRLSGPQRNAFLQLLLVNALISLLPGISFMGHLGGFAAGFAMAYALGLRAPR